MAAGKYQRAAYYVIHNAIFSVDDILKTPLYSKKCYRSFITLNKSYSVF